MINYAPLISQSLLIYKTIFTFDACNPYYINGDAIDIISR